MAYEWPPIGWKICLWDEGAEAFNKFTAADFDKFMDTVYVPAPGCKFLSHKMRKNEYQDVELVYTVANPDIRETVVTFLIGPSRKPDALPLNPRLPVAITLDENIFYIKKTFQYLGSLISWRNNDSEYYTFRPDLWSSNSDRPGFILNFQGVPFVEFSKESDENFIVTGYTERRYRIYPESSHTSTHHLMINPYDVIKRAPNPYTPVSYEFSEETLDNSVGEIYYTVKFFSGCGKKVPYTVGSWFYDFVWTPNEFGVLHSPWTNEDMFLSSMVLKTISNASGTFEFTVPATNPAVSMLSGGSYIQITKSDKKPEADPLQTNKDIGELYWFGRVISIDVDLYGNKNVIAEGPLGFLKDLKVMSAKIASVLSWPIGTPYSKVLKDIIYNAEKFCYQATDYADGEFVRPNFLRIGNLTITPDLDSKHEVVPIDNTPFVEIGSTPGYLTIKSTDDSNIFDLITELYGGLGQVDLKEILENNTSFYHPGYIALEMEPVGYSDPTLVGVNVPIVQYINANIYYQDVTGYDMSEQTVIFGENLLSAKLEEDYSELGTTIMFLGAERTYSDWSGAESEAKTRYGGFNGYLDSVTNHKLYGPYINATSGAVERYGLIPKVVINDNWTSDEQVWAVASAYRNIYSTPVRSFTANVVDLANYQKQWSSISNASGRFQINQNVNIIFATSAFDKLDPSYSIPFKCTEIDEDLLDPTKTQITFQKFVPDTSSMSLSTRSTSNIKRLSKKLDSAEKTILKLRQEIEELKKDGDKNG